MLLVLCFNGLNVSSQNLSYQETLMFNRIVLILLIILIPISANASDMTGMFTFYHGLFIVVPAIVIHIIATIFFAKKGYYQSKKFTTQYLIVAMLIPLIGVGLSMYEYALDISTTGIHIGTLVSIVFVYGLLSLIFAVPYILYISNTTKTS